MPNPNTPIELTSTINPADVWNRNNIDRVLQDRIQQSGQSREQLIEDLKARRKQLGDKQQTQGLSNNDIKSLYFLDAMARNGYFE